MNISTKLDLENSWNLDSLFAVLDMCFNHEKNIFNKEAGSVKYILYILKLLFRQAVISFGSIEMFCSEPGIHQASQV